MVWDQYVYEATVGCDVVDDAHDDDYIDTNAPLHVVDWSEWYSDDLLNMWMLLRRYLDDNGLGTRILRDATLSDFSRFIYDRSDPRPGP